MKTTMLLIGLCILTISTQVGCVATNVDSLRKVKLGMSQDEIVALAGEPRDMMGSTKNSSNQTVEVWEYAMKKFGPGPRSLYLMYFCDGKLVKWVKAKRAEKRGELKDSSDFSDIYSGELSEIRVDYKTSYEKKDRFDKEETIENMRGAVVTIILNDGHGSGFIVSEDGYILTNNHVVGDSRFVKVKFTTGREVMGEVIRTNKKRDVALVKLEKDSYPYLKIGDSSKIKIGDEVFAIGSPLSKELSQTVSKGIISSFRIFEGVRFIQSDVSVQQGNSGGPLLSVKEGVVGICVAETGFWTFSGTISAGLNYFIPIEEAIKELKIIQVK